MSDIPGEYHVGLGVTQCKWTQICKNIHEVSHLHYRHTTGFLFRQVENNVEILRHNLQSNEEITFELLDCLVFNIGNHALTTLPDSNFQTEDQRSAWERDVCLFIKGKSPIKTKNIK
jgi:hypothetical protein